MEILTAAQVNIYLNLSINKACTNIIFSLKKSFKSQSIEKIYLRKKNYKFDKLSIFIKRNILSLMKRYFY